MKQTGMRIQLRLPVQCTINCIIFCRLWWDIRWTTLCDRREASIEGRCVWFVHFQHRIRGLRQTRTRISPTLSTVRRSILFRASNQVNSFSWKSLCCLAVWIIYLFTTKSCTYYSRRKL